ncbi:MAG: ribosomal-processing cysteine protease Prp [Candidatus Rifleibacteriota bacterium]
MVVVEFPQPRNSGVRIKVTGHSGYKEKGEDIVCSAVSALVQTMAGGIQRSLNGKISGKLQPEDSELIIIVDSDKFDKLKLICDVFRFGFQKISESYPEHVKLI